MLVQGAHYILGPFGEDSDLRRWGLKLAARREKCKEASRGCGSEKTSGTAASVVVNGEVYEPLHNSHKEMRAVAYTQQGMLGVEGVGNRRS